MTNVNNGPLSTSTHSYQTIPSLNVDCSGPSHAQKAAKPSLFARLNAFGGSKSMRDDAATGPSRDRSILWGALGALAGAGSGAVLTLWSWEGLKSTFGNHETDFSVTVDGDATGHADLVGSGTATIDGEASGTLEGSATGTITGSGEGDISGAGEGTVDGTVNGTLDGVSIGPFNLDVGGEAGATGEGSAVGTGSIDGTGAFDGTAQGTTEGTAEGEIVGSANGDLDFAVDAEMGADFNADLDGSGFFDIPGAPIQVVLSAVAIFATVVGAFAFVTAKLCYLIDIEKKDKDMRANREEQPERRNEIEQQKQALQAQLAAQAAENSELKKKMDELIKNQVELFKLMKSASLPQVNNNPDLGNAIPVT